MKATTQYVFRGTVNYTSLLRRLYEVKPYWMTIYLIIIIQNNLRNSFIRDDVYVARINRG